MWLESFGRLWVQNWHFLYFLCYCFVFNHNCSIKIGISWLFRTCFRIKAFSQRKLHTKYNVGSSTILIESLKFRKQLQDYSNFSHNLLWKMWIWGFWILCFAIIFLQKWSCKAWLRNDSTEKQINGKTQATINHKLLTEKKM